ncbi:MAG: PGF-pre-PGF domain-containing protein [Candidatus Pacearchaeota archaeon]|nr:PGF-pre-PGF domain-containing protein [Candidatus Pacearchaeota archaeon]
MKKEVGKEKVLFFLFVGVLCVFVFLTFFNNIPVVAGDYVKWGNGPYYYNCSTCAECNNATINASAGDTIFLNATIFLNYPMGPNCININYKSNIIFDCQNYWITNNTWVAGISLAYTNNSQIKNCNLSLFSSGINMNHSNNNTFTNIITTYSKFDGLNLLRSYNNTFTDITSAYNSHSGIHLNLSSSNSFTNLNLNNNLYSGIHLNLSSSNSFTSVNSSNNTYGIVLVGSSQNNMTNSHLEDNNYGFFFYDSYNNLFYNNYFNNTHNYYSYNMNPLQYNFFNITKTLAENIIGGDYLGGNFWGTLNNTGFSQNCTDDDNDGICDEPYNINDTTFDYLALNMSAIPILPCVESWTCGSWGTCNISGYQTRTCSDGNSCGTIVDRPALVQSCTYEGSTGSSSGTTGGSSGGSSTGGSSGSTSGVSGTEGIGTTVTEDVNQITPEQPVEVHLDDSQIYLTKMSINVLESVQSISVTVTKVNVLEDANLKIGLPQGQFYQAFQIETQGTENSNIANVTIEFKVNKVWLENQNGSTESIGLFRRPDTSSQWNSLTTVYERADDTYYYFTSFSPGFSTFAVFFNACEGAECEEKSPVSIWTYIIIFAAILVIIVSFIIFRKFKKK